MVDIAKGMPGLIDMSFMASLECDLNCAHCMYSSSSSTKDRLDYDVVKRWVQTAEWGQIHSCGFYGGEPSILLDWYARFIQLVPESIPKFIITGGSWSKNKEKTNEFVSFVHQYNLIPIVSGTRWHRPFQDLSVLEKLRDEEGFTLKGEESQIIAMGRAKLWLKRPCTFVCQSWSKPWRIALHPTQDIIFQSCDGEYPRLQGYDEPFANILPNIAKLVLSRRPQ